MDRSETLAQHHLAYQGFRDIVYEPDGNVPPDFLLDKRIAVEVRRLNENERTRPTPKGLEEVEIPLTKRLTTLLHSYGPAASSAGWWVAVRFRRPVPRWKDIEVDVRAFFDAVRKGDAGSRPVRSFSDHLVLEAFSRAGTGDHVFELKIWIDEDSGGMLIDELERNLRVVIREKSQKVAPVRDRYAEWWLLLVDHIAFGLSEFDLAQFRRDVHIDHDWDKVILVNPGNHTHYCEL